MYYRNKGFKIKSPDFDLTREAIDHFTAHPEEHRKQDLMRQLFREATNTSKLLNLDPCSHAKTVKIAAVEHRLTELLTRMSQKDREAKKRNQNKQMCPYSHR